MSFYIAMLTIEYKQMNYFWLDLFANWNPTMGSLPNLDFSLWIYSFQIKCLFKTLVLQCEIIE